MPDEADGWLKADVTDHVAVGWIEADGGVNADGRVGVEGGTSVWNLLYLWQIFACISRYIVHMEEYSFIENKIPIM